MELAGQLSELGIWLQSLMFDFPGCLLGEEAVCIALGKVQSPGIYLWALYISKMAEIVGISWNQFEGILIINCKNVSMLCS